MHIDTHSVLGSTQSPSNSGQLTTLAGMFVDELLEIGLTDATVNESCYVTATLPAAVSVDAPVIGLIAHLDTNPQSSGTSVEPIVNVRVEQQYPLDAEAHA
jgi:tripeptide aminopeptidase